MARSKSRLKPFQFHDEVYGVPIYLAHCPAQELESWFAREHLVDVELVEDAKAQTIWMGGHLIFWFSPDVKVKTVDGLSTITHEACHGTAFILSDRGVSLKDGEAIAYHQSWLFRELLARLNPKFARS